MIITLDRDIKDFPHAEAEDIYRYNGDSISVDEVNNFPNNASLKAHHIAEIITNMHLYDIPVTKESAKIAAKVYERDKDAFSNVFLSLYKYIGSINCYHALNNEAAKADIEDIEKELTERFQEKYRGRAPQIVKAMAIMSYLYKIPQETIVESFDVNKVRDCLRAAKLSPAETTILMVGANGTKSPAIYKSETARYAVKCYSSYYKGKGELFKNAADWITEHPDTNIDLIKKIAKRAEDLDIHADTTVEGIKAKLGTLSSLSEVEKIEKAYKECKFKFRNCEFDLKFSDTIHNGFRMEILRPGDTRMVYLGDFTHCCQRLYDVGESAMMHGLLNPKAGFWAMTDERTGRVVAQAEIWEKEGDSNTLVFDNIEFANDAEISLYKSAIAKWLQESPYQNIYMGTGYNEIYYNGNFRQTVALTPSVTPYEVYVISHENGSEAPVFDSEEAAAKALEEGRVTYFDYVYCDSERNTVIMKENGVLEPYFALENEDLQLYNILMQFHRHREVNYDRMEDSIHVQERETGIHEETGDLDEDYHEEEYT